MHTSHHQDPTTVDLSQMALALPEAPADPAHAQQDRFALLESRTREITVEPSEDTTGQAATDEWDLWAGDGRGGHCGFWPGWTTTELLQLRARGHVAIHDRTTGTTWTP